MNTTRVFIHGLESSSKGTKGIYFKNRYLNMIIEDYLGNFQKRMNKLNGLLNDKTNLILVGSSYGGLMATIYALKHPDKIKKLILLAPALNLKDFKPYLNTTLNLPVTVYHGNQDTVVPVNKVRDIATKVFTNCTYIMVDDNHALHKTFETYDWNSLLEYLN